MDKIYIVYGSSGEYDEWEEHSIKAFTSENKAKEFVELAQKEADEISAYYEKLEKRPDF